VFCSRTRKRLPKELGQLRTAHWTIGTIANEPHQVYDKLNHAEGITEDMVLKTREGSGAIQYVFHNDEGEESLEAHGAPGLKVFPLTAEEYRVWHSSRT
jgi:hypothetical protein